MTADFEPTTAVMGPAASQPMRLRWDWLGLVPFLVFSLLFLLAPVLYLVIGAFQGPDGQLTLDNMRGLAAPNIASSFWLSIRLSLASALMGTVTGLFLAHALVMGGLPSWIRKSLTTFSGVASNFAGVPLAFAFIATLGRLGLISVLLRDLFNFNRYGTGFSLFSFWGLALTYLYFQMPLMLLVISPALEGMKPEWQEAAESQGASGP